MFLKGIIFLVILNNLCACKSVNEYEYEYNINKDTDFINKDTWLTRMRAIRRDVKDCVKKNSDTTWTCLKVTSLKLFDEMISSKVIPIWRGIRLVQVADYSDDRTTISSDAVAFTNGDAGAVAQRDAEGFVYLDQIAERLTRVLQTHALQVSFKDIVDGFVLDDKGKSSQVHGSPRHRRHRYNMMIAMVFGITALGAVMVPVGFQVLSVISGKALLLAKMALLLASINGLKRIANSGVHYGLYHVPHDPFGYHGYYDRGDTQHPRTVPNLLAHPVEEH